MGGVPQSLFLLSLSLTLLTFSTPSYLPVINPPPSSHNLSCDLLSERVQPECATSSSAASAPAKQSARGVANILNKQRSGDTICNQHQLAVSSATSPSPLTTTSPGRSSPTLTLLAFSTTRSTSHLLSCDLLSERVQPECATSSSAASAPAKQSARGVANILNKQPSGDTICNQHQLAVSSATVCPDTPHQRGLLCRPPARQRALHQQLHRSLGAYTHVRAIGSWVDASIGR